MTTETVTIEHRDAAIALTDRRPDEPEVGTVVALHAGVADRRAFDVVAPVWVADGWRVVAYDRRGFGDTRAESESEQGAMDDLLAVLDGVGVDRAVLVGNSMGGTLAVDTALAHPARTLGLVVSGSRVGGQPWDPDRITPEERELASAMESAEAEGDVDAVNELEAHYWLDGPSSERGRVDGPPRSLFLDMNGRALRAGFVGDVTPAPDSWSRLGELSVPTTVVVGRLDERDTVAACEQLADTIDGARLVELEGSAHLPMLDDPDGFAAAVTELLTRVRA